MYQFDLQRINGIREDILNISLNFHLTKEPKLISLNINSIVDEYCRFIYALISCRKVAENEYHQITSELENITALRIKLNSLQNSLNGLDIISDVNLDEDDCKSQADCSRELKKTMDSFSTRFLSTIEEIEKHITKEANELKKFKIVLFGRTKVGKSTVREALTQGNGDSIGKGGQSTTKENHEYNWYNLQVYDTPGILSTKDTNIDAHDGIGDEERKARELLKRSDIAIFMFATDNIETLELDYLKDVAASGKEILVLLNVKSDISDYRMYKLRKKEREIAPEAQYGHINRINGAIDKKVTILPIHAQAAFFSRARNNRTVNAFYEKYETSRDELYELSHFGEIRDFIVRNILGKGSKIRCQTLWKYFISQIQDFAKENRTPVDKSKDKILRYQTLINRTDTKLERLITEYENSLKAKLLQLAKDRTDTYDYASDCIYGGYSKDSIKYGWQSKLECLSELPPVIIKAFSDEVQTIVNELQQNLNFESNTSNNFDGYEIEMDLSGMFKGAGLLSNLGATAALLGWIPGGGWAIAGLAILGAVFAWIGGLFKSKTTKIRELREKLDASLISACDNLSSQLADFMRNKIFSSIRAKMNIMKTSQQNMLNLCNDFLALNDSLFTQADKHEKYLTRKLREFN